MKNLKYKMPKDYEHYFLGDIHYKVMGFNDNKFRKFIEKEIMDKKNVTFSLGGDNIDSMNPLDPRFKFEAQDPKHQKTEAQMRGVVDLLKPYKDRLLWVLHGNHESRVWNIINVAGYIAEQLDADYGTYLAKVQLGDIRVLDWHGSGAINSRAGDMMQRYNNECISVKRKLRDVAGISDCEVGVMHHIHKIRVHPPSCKDDLMFISENDKLKSVYPTPTRVPIGNSKTNYYIHDDHRWYASSGAFFPGYQEGFSTYIEERGYKATEMGCVKVVVKRGKVESVDKVFY